MQLIAENIYNGLDVYVENAQEVYTRQQIGTALGYKNPKRAIGFIHDRHKAEFENTYSVFTVNTPKGKRETFVYNAQGVIRICAYSSQPRAKELLFIITDRMQRVLKQEQRLHNLFHDKYVEIYEEYEKLHNELYPKAPPIAEDSKPTKLIKVDNLAGDKTYLRDFVQSNRDKYLSKGALYTTYSTSCWEGGKFVQLSRRRFNECYDGREVTR